MCQIRKDIRDIDNLTLKAAIRRSDKLSERHWLVKGSRVAGYALTNRKGEVETAESDEGCLDAIDHLERVHVCVPSVTTFRTERISERALSCMSEGWMPKVVRQSDRFGQRLIGTD